LIEKEPLARIDYVAVIDSDTLEPVENIEDRVVILATAVFFGKTRLIDNIRLNRKQ
jgi:pantoate--beta-alanine ligase